MSKRGPFFLLDTNTGSIIPMPTATKVAAVTGFSLATVIRARQQLAAIGPYRVLTQAQADALSSVDVEAPR